MYQRTLSQRKNITLGGESNHGSVSSNFETTNRMVFQNPGK